VKLSYFADIDSLNGRDGRCLEFAVRRRTGRRRLRKGTEVTLQPITQDEYDRLVAVVWMLPRDADPNIVGLV
jgi:hypothetical protein